MRTIPRLCAVAVLCAAPAWADDAGKGDWFPNRVTPCAGPEVVRDGVVERLREAGRLGGASTSTGARFEAQGELGVRLFPQLTSCEERTDLFHTRHIVDRSLLLLVDGALPFSQPGDWLAGAKVALNQRWRVEGWGGAEVSSDLAGPEFWAGAGPVRSQRAWGGEIAVSARYFLDLRLAYARMADGEQRVSVHVGLGDPHALIAVFLRPPERGYSSETRH